MLTQLGRVVYIQTKDVVCTEKCTAEWPQNEYLRESMWWILVTL